LDGSFVIRNLAWSRVAGAILFFWLEQRCVALWQEVKHPEQKDRTIAEVWADEQPHLMPLPPPFDGFVEHTKRVSPTCLLAFERDRYSVPSSFANRPGQPTRVGRAPGGGR